ncbi:MAG: radical SAM protein [Pseudobdellovibrionaceae bacterium]
MTLRRIGDILAMKTEAGPVLGFHSRNLEVAELSEQAWEAATSPDSESEALTELKNWSKEESSEVKSGKISFGIRSITLNVTQVCNLACTYCAAGGDGTYGDPVKKISVEKTLPQIKFLLAKVPKGEFFHLNFLGGEPLLYPEAIEMIANYAQEIANEREIELKFVITTNGTLLTQKNIDMLVRIKCHVNVSLDGPPEINDRVRPGFGGKPMTAKVVEGLKDLVARKRELGTVGVSAVFDAQNLEVEKAYDFLSTLNLDYVELNFSHTETNPEANQRFMDEFKAVAAKAWARGGEKELRKIKTFENYFRQLDSQQRVENFCGAGKSYLMIDARNQMYTCPWLVGDKTEIVGVGETFFESKLKPYEDQLVESNQCGGCWARYMCGGGCMYIHKNATGSKNQVDPEFCKRSRFTIAVSLLYYHQSRAVAQMAMA